MLHNYRDRVPQLVRKPRWLAALLLTFAIVGGPAVPAAAAEPTFSVQLSRNSALPGDGVTVSFSSPNTTVAITGCTARFNAAETVDCQQTGDHWAAQLSVPNDAAAGPMPILWSVSYGFNGPDGFEPGGDQNGSRDFTVLQPSPSPSPVEPTFSVQLSRNSALPGDGVTVSFSSPNTTVAITGCTARFNAAETVDCQQTGDHWAAQLSVPNNATAGTGSVRWMISYQRAAGSSGDVLGVLSLTVLAPNRTPPPTPNPHSNPLGIWLIIGGLLAVVGILLAFVLRSFLRRDRHPLHPPASQLVGAVAHAGPELQVTTRQSEPRRNRLIRFVSHRPAPVSEIEEVRR